MWTIVLDLHHAFFVTYSIYFQLSYLFQQQSIFLCISFSLLLVALHFVYIYLLLRFFLLFTLCSLLYHFKLFGCHMSPPFFSDPGFFFSQFFWFSEIFQNFKKITLWLNNLKWYSSMIYFHIYSVLVQTLREIFLSIYLLHINHLVISCFY